MARPNRKVKCQVCSFSEVRWYGEGILVAPCPKCGSRMTYAVWQPGDQPVKPDPKLAAVAA